MFRCTGLCRPTVGRIATLLLAAGVVTSSVAAAPAAAAPSAPLVAKYSQLPLSFEVNRGQFDPSIRFMARNGRGTVALTDQGAVLAVSKGNAQSVVRMHLVGADQGAISGVSRLRGVANYYYGNNPAKWITGVPTYDRVRYASVYPGTDVVFYGNDRKLEYDFVVKPGADAGRIRLSFSGAQRLSVAANGDLVASTPLGDILLQRPYAYQSVNGRRVQVACSYSVSPDRGVSFRTARYDATRPLVIDPSLTWATYFGGFGNDSINGIAVTALGPAVTGTTNSPNLPLFAPMMTYNGLKDIFVSQLNPAGNALVFSTYIGWQLDDEATAIAAAPDGSLYVVGRTASVLFPTTPGALKSVLGGLTDAVVMKFVTGGVLEASTLLGGLYDDSALAVAADATGVYVAGTTAPNAFPVTTGAWRTSAGGGTDGFVVKIDPTLSTELYGTLIPGNGNDEARAIAVDSSGNAYVAGHSTSTNLPTTTGAFQTAANSDNAFALKLNATGTSASYCTYLSGSTGTSSATGIAVDPAGNAYVSGNTDSTNFPTTAGAYRTTTAGGGDGFVAKLNATGTALGYSTYLGAAAGDTANAIAVDYGGHATITGALGGTNLGLAQLKADGSGLVTSFLLSGGTNAGTCIAPAAAGLYYVGGTNSGGGFAATAGAFQGSNAGGTDGVVALYLLQESATLTVSAPAAAVGSYVNVTGKLVRTDTSAAISGATIGLTYNGTSLGTAVTNASGEAVINYLVPVGTTPGSVPLAAVFAGNDGYIPTTATGTATVNAARTVFISAPSYTVGKSAPLTVYTYLYEPSTPKVLLAGRTVKFTVAGLGTATAVTDSDGYATYSTSINPATPAGDYAITYSFDGDATHAAVSKSGTITVIDGQAIRVYVAPQPNGIPGITVPLYAYVYSASTGAMIPGVGVDIQVDGGTVASLVTDASGRAATTYYIAPTATLGAHTITGYHAYDGTYATATGRNTLTVNGKTDTAMYCRGFNVAPGTAVKLYVYLWRIDNRELLQGRSVTFKVNGTLVGTGITDATGYAKVPYTVQAGDTTILAEFAGDSTCNPSTKSATITNP